MYPKIEQSSRLTSILYLVSCIWKMRLHLAKVKRRLTSAHGSREGLAVSPVFGESVWKSTTLLPLSYHLLAWKCVVTCLGPSILFHWAIKPTQKFQGIGSHLCPFTGRPFCKHILLAPLAKKKGKSRNRITPGVCLLYRISKKILTPIGMPCQFLRICIVAAA